jgi:WD40 repeat protein
MKRTAPLVLLGCFVALSCTKKEAKYLTETIDGVKVVRYLAVKPEKALRRLKFVEDLSIGGEEATGENLLYSPRDIDADSSGNIYVLDSRDALIRRFDGNGDFVRPIGRKGQGPGEFERPACMEVAPGGTIVVADPTQMRLMTMAPNGDFIKMTLVKDWISEFSCGPNGVIIAGYDDSKSSEFRVGPLDLETGRITSFFSQATYWPARYQNKKVLYDFPYLVRWALSSTNKLFVGAAVDYEISVMDLRGGLEFKFRKDHERVHVQGEILKEISSMALSGPNLYVKNPYYPVFESLAIDERDRVWIQHYQPKWADLTNRETPYDVFSPEGIFLFEARVPGHVYSKLIFKNGFIYALKKTESGYPKAVRLKVEE